MHATSYTSDILSRVEKKLADVKKNEQVGGKKQHEEENLNNCCQNHDFLTYAHLTYAKLAF